ncbi:hypothetical protein HUT06_27570 [Actinomadura sp. NAK00032]|uniref:hypothetical protein n=1 Tax=Actinomadura sp. NAK00032 TaxID=2742128 RepID=UPI001590E9FA|nr:hypothetical protein [Actinomadura sp. NAK00032]QKW37307.1 hypothetical protein HUT06_27570 [Actinomadura sp. NAK00032]
MNIRRAAVRAAVAVGVAGAVLSPVGSAFADAAAPAAASKYYYNTWITADSYHWVGNGHPHWWKTGGKLFAGRNYFYCQNDWGIRHTDKYGNTNTWWAQTDDDSGNRKVWVSATVFTVGGQNERIPGLPDCY